MATPSGIIAIWAGTLATIPVGWKLCDGTNSTPDLRSSFVKGVAAEADPGGTGGSNTHSHSDHPEQTHSGFDVANHSLPHSGFSIADHTTNDYKNTGSTAINISYTHSVTQPNNHTLSHSSITQPSSHAAQSHDTVDIQPTYYTVAFIMKI